MKIFLSGGTKGNWQDKVKETFPSEHFFDPRTLKAESMRIIATREREWLDECDLLFFYFERDNPSGLGSAFEVGYCAAKGIPIIYVDEKLTSHSEWIGVHCPTVVHTFEEGISCLRSALS